MMGQSEGGARQSEVMRKALIMLDSMERSVEDDLIYNHVSMMLEKYDERKVETEQLFCSLISMLLGSLSLHLSQDDTLSTQIKILQLRLTNPITQAENEMLQHYVETCADFISLKKTISPEKIEATLEPLFNFFGLRANNPSASHDSSSTGKSVTQFFSSSPLSESLAHNEKIGALLVEQLNVLKQLEDTTSNDEEKQGMLGELEQMSVSHQEMTQHFKKMSELVSLVQKDSLRLTEELDRVTQLSLTDELTELPNRRAFLRRLKDEVASAKRYEYDLSLAILDLDYFKPINDKYGHTIGDKVLKAYSNKVLSGFREQDMVARYGGEEFVVIFPNTGIPGALQALKKVQECTKTALLPIHENQIKLPTFSAGLICYQAGESIDVFIQRADNALYEAKNKGRNRIEVKLPEYEAVP